MYRKILLMILFAIIIGISSLSINMSLFMFALFTLMLMFVNDRIPVYVFLFTIPLFNVSKYYFNILLSFNEYLLISVFLFLLIFRHNKSSEIFGVHAVMITYIVILICSFIIHADVAQTIMLKEMMKFVLYIFTFYIAVLFIKDYKALEGTIIVILISAAFVAMNAILQYVIGTSVQNWQPWGPKFEFTAGRIRSYSTFDNPIYLGVYMILIIGIIIGVMKYVQTMYIRNLLIIHFSICLLALFFSFSRGGWVGLVGSIVLISVFVLRQKGFIPLITLLSTFYVAILVLPSVFMERLYRVVDFADSSIIQRFYVYESAINMIKDNMLWGIGPGRFKEVYPIYQNSYSSADTSTFTAENTFLEYFVENGIMIIILYVFLWIWFYKNTYYVYRNNNHPIVQGYALGTLIGMTALLIDSMFAQITNSAIVMLYWFIFGAAFALRNLTKRDIDENIRFQ